MESKRRITVFSQKIAKIPFHYKMPGRHGGRRDGAGRKPARSPQWHVRSRLAHFGFLRGFAQQQQEQQHEEQQQPNVPEELQAAVIPEQPLPQQPILQQETAVVGDQQPALHKQSAVIQEQQVLQEQPVIQEQQVIQQPNYDADEYNTETEEITRGKKLEKSKNLQWQRNRINKNKVYRAACEKICSHGQFWDYLPDRILNASHSIQSCWMDFYQIGN